MQLGHPDWWDSNSDQPYRLPSESKNRTSTAHINEYSKTLLSTVAIFPLLCYQLLRSKNNTKERTKKDFIGLGISNDRGDSNEIIDMVEDLGVDRLLIRVPTWKLHQLERYVEFASKFTEKKILINILQNRANVIDPDSWMTAVEKIIEAFSPITNEFQLGNAVNRSKWGCSHVGEYLTLLDNTKDLRKTFPNVCLVGSSIIDFEPLSTLRTLINFHKYKLDACTSLLYVNRRGSPYNRQFGIFDLERKIKLISGLLSLSNRVANHLWITETNWPLLNTKPFTPNSGNQRSTVNEHTQANYLTEYYKIAWKTGQVERVYWWQLIQTGYGLVDHRFSKLRKMPSYFALKNLCNENDSLS